MLWEHTMYHRFEAFFLICVDHLVLTVAILNRVNIRADPIDYSPSSYRKAAYRVYLMDTWISWKRKQACCTFMCSPCNKKVVPFPHWAIHGF